MASGEEKEAADSNSGPLPGEPVPDDQLDPELIALPRPKARVGPVLSTSVIVLSVFLLLRLWPDFSFSRAEEPQSFASVAELLDKSEDDAFVAVPAMPDLTVGTVVRSSKGSYGHRLRPVLGSGGDLWIMSHSYHWHAKPVYHLTYRGRLRSLGDMPFWDQLHDDWKPGIEARRVVRSEPLRKALLDGADTVEVAGGDHVSLDSDRVVEISETVPERVAVTTYYTEDYADEAAWTLALQQAGLDMVEGRAEGRGPEGEQFFYQVRHPGGPDAVDELLRENQINAARAEAVVREHRQTLGELKASAAGLAPPGKDPIAWSSMDLIRLVARYPIRPDAKVVIATDRPQDYWHVLPLVVVLFVAALFFSFLLGRTVLQLVRK